MESNNLFKASILSLANLESKVVFLEEGNFGLTSLLNDLQLHDRPGVFSMPSFPKEFAGSSFDRQTLITPMFLADTSLQQRQINNWIKLGALDKRPGIKGEALDAVFKEVKGGVDKIRARGGSVVFVRPPSTGGYLETEKTVYPRKEYWDALLAYVNVAGIHYTDYPQSAKLVCVEWSHLSPRDAVTYTEELVKILNKKGWTFRKDTPQ